MTTSNHNALRIVPTGTSTSKCVPNGTSKVSVMVMVQANVGQKLVKSNILRVFLVPIAYIFGLLFA
jgi:hypothetical protein